MGQFKIIDRVGLPPYRYVVEHRGNLIFGRLYKGIRPYKVGEMLDYSFLGYGYDCLQKINKITGIIEYDEDVPF